MLCYPKDSWKNLKKWKNDIEYQWMINVFILYDLKDNESNLRSVFLEAIRDSSLKRILWVSENDPSDEILDIDNLAYLHHSKYENLIDQILELESKEEIEFGFKEIT